MWADPSQKPSSILPTCDIMNSHDAVISLTMSSIIEAVKHPVSYASMNFTTPQFTHSVTRNFVTLKNDCSSEKFHRIYHCSNIMEQPHSISWKMLENLSHARYVSKWVVTIQELPHGQAHSLLLARGRKEPGNNGGFKLLNSGTWISGSSNRLHDWTTLCDHSSALRTGCM